MGAQRQKQHGETATKPIPDSLLYPDRYDVSDVEDESRQELEDQEYCKFELNLGAETPRTGSSSTFPLDESYLVSRLSGTKEAPSRGKLWRSASFYDKLRRRNALEHEKEGGRLDTDCGICFEVAVSPARTLCCGKLFCTDHITDWLQGPSSDGRCPACGAFSAGINTMPSSSTIKIFTPPPSLAASRPRSRNESTGLVPTITLQCPTRRSTISSDEETSSEEDCSSTSSESSNSSWDNSSSPHNTPQLKWTSVSVSGMDSESTSNMIGNFLSLVGLTLVLYVLVS